MTLITRVITRRDVSFRRVSRVVLQETLPFPYADFLADLAVSPTFLIFSVIWMEFEKNPGEFKIANFTETNKQRYIEGFAPGFSSFVDGLL